MNTPLLIVLIGGIILLWPQISQAFTTTGASGGRLPGGRLPSPDGTLFPPDGAMDSPFVSGGGGAGGNTAGGGVIPSVGAGAGAIGTALGLSAAVAAGIAAAGGILAWGIITRGWFRGGEEAMYVNPARDEFKSLFAHLNPYSSSCSDPNGPGFFGLAWLLNQLGRDDLMTKFNQADTKREWEAAALDIDMLLAQSVGRVQELVNYTIAAGFPGAACTPNPSLPWEA